VIAVAEGLASTVAEVWDGVSRRLTEAGISNGPGEAKELVSRVLGVPRKSLDVRRADRWPPGVAHGLLNSLVRQRLAHIPLAYLLGEWDFGDMTLTVTPDVLIPRPETEELFEWMARDVAASGVVPSCMVDVGTGAGGLVLAMARQWPTARGTAIDLSVGALAVARWNARRHGVETALEFRRADLLEGTRDGSVDLIAANMPYIETSDLAGLSRDVLKEPRRALDGGPDGLALIRRLIPQAFRALRPGGKLFLEVGRGQTEEVTREMDNAGFSGVCARRDTAGILRFLRGVR
jgi:release factor glutamine methyltransferase